MIISKLNDLYADAVYHPVDQQNSVSKASKPQQGRSLSPGKLVSHKESQINSQAFSLKKINQQVDKTRNHSKM